MPRLEISRFDGLVGPGPLLYDTVECLLLQGRKRISIGSDVLA
jgi:hypothetical protein